MKFLKLMACIMLVLSINNVSSSEINFYTSINTILHHCCNMSVEARTRMGHPVIKHCKFFDKVSPEICGTRIHVRKVFGNPNSEILEIETLENNINSNIEIINRPELNPIHSNNGFILCEDELYLSHVLETGTQRIWSVFDDIGYMKEIARCNV